MKVFGHVGMQHSFNHATSNQRELFGLGIFQHIQLTIGRQINDRSLHVPIRSMPQHFHKGMRSMHIF